MSIWLVGARRRRAVAATVSQRLAGLVIGCGLAACRSLEQLLALGLASRVWGNVTASAGLQQPVCANG